jgi:deoxycytidylate deaminase
MKADRYLNLAIKVARQGIHKRYRVGAVLVLSQNVISVGANSFKTHPKMGFRTLHAEISALIGVRYKNINHSSIYVARLNSQGIVGMAKPCTTCQTILKEYGVHEVYYTNRDGKLEKIKLGG